MNVVAVCNLGGGSGDAGLVQTSTTTTMLMTDDSVERKCVPTCVFSFVLRYSKLNGGKPSALEIVFPKLCFPFRAAAATTTTLLLSTSVGIDSRSTHPGSVWERSLVPHR